MRAPRYRHNSRIMEPANAAKIGSVRDPNQVAAAASECAGIFGPADTLPRSAITVATAARPQKVGGAARPGATLGHDLAHARGPSIGRVGAREIDPLGCERSVSN